MKVKYTCLPVIRLSTEVIYQPDGFIARYLNIPFFKENAVDIEEKIADDLEIDKSNLEFIKCDLTLTQISVADLS